jgi:hypothetical protein
MMAWLGHNATLGADSNKADHTTHEMKQINYECRLRARRDLQALMAGSILVAELFAQERPVRHGENEEPRLLP